MSVWRARELRKTMTPAETRMWVRLRALRPQGWRFRRQVPFQVYILDFACFSHRLVVELDGGQHTEPEQAAHDARRDAMLAREGFRTLRYANSAVMHDPDAVTLGITQVLRERAPP